MNVIYQLFKFNDEDKYFDLYRTSKVGFLPLTKKIKTAPAQRQSYKDFGIKEIIHSKKSRKNKKGNYVKLFHNGLIPTENPYVFCGDNYEIKRGFKIKSFVLFEFSKCGLWLLVHYVEKYKVFPNQRKKVINDLLISSTRKKFIDFIKQK